MGVAQEPVRSVGLLDQIAASGKRHTNAQAPAGCTLPASEPPRDRKMTRRNTKQSVQSKVSGSEPRAKRPEKGRGSLSEAQYRCVTSLGHEPGGDT
jgi:hypothetical protein